MLGPSPFLAQHDFPLTCDQGVIVPGAGDAGAPVWVDVDPLAAPCRVVQRPLAAPLPQDEPGGRHLGEGGAVPGGGQAGAGVGAPGQGGLDIVTQPLRHLPYTPCSTARPEQQCGSQDNLNHLDLRLGWNCTGF